jgi:predicted AlkP superfamily phosphohydrolase/phosphomutase
LKGREVAGVAPPAAYDALCEQIADSLGSFVDAATGEPLVAEVCLAKGLFAAGPALDRLPDLVVCWQDSPAAAHEAVVSGRFGRIERATPGRIPNGRSGNHRSEGFVIARGAVVPPGSSLGEADILDLAPTALHLLGADRCDALPGTPVGLICGTPSRSPMRLR